MLSRAVQITLRWGPRLGLSFVVGALVVWFVVVASFDSLAKSFVAGLNRRSLFKLEIGQASLSWSRVEVLKPRLLTADGQVLLEAKRAVGGWSLHQGLAVGGWHWVRDVDFFDVDAHFAQDREGHLNWSKIFGPSSGKTSAFWLEYRGRLSVQKGVINYRDAREGGFAYSIQGVEGSADIAPGQPVKVSARASNGSPPASAQLQAEFNPVHPQLSARLETAGWPLLELGRHPKLGSALSIRSGQGSGQLWLTGEGKTWGDLWKKLQPELHAKIQEVEAGVTQLPEPARKVEGELRWTSGMLDIAQLKGQILGGSFDAHGRVVPATPPDFPHAQLLVRGTGIDIGKFSARLQPQLRPIAGKVGFDVEVEGSLKNPSVRGQLKSAKLTIAGKVLQPLFVNFQWAAGALHLQELTASTQGGKISAQGWVFPTVKDGQTLMLKVKAEGAHLGELFPTLGSQARVDGTLTILGRPQDPLVSGQGALSGMAGMDPQVQVNGAQAHLLADRDGAIVYDGKVDSNFGQISLLWGMLDFKQHFAAASLASRHLRLPSQAAQGVSGQADASVTVHGRLDQPETWTAVGGLANGSASYGGERLSQLSGSFLFKNGSLWTPGLFADWGGGKLALVGGLDRHLKRLEGVVRGSGISFHKLTHNALVHSDARVPAGSADFIAALQSQPGQSYLQGWLSSDYGDAAAIGFGSSPTVMSLMAWGSQLSAKDFGFADFGKVSGQLAVQPEGGRRHIYYEGSAKNVELLGEAWMSGSSLQPGRAWLTLPGLQMPRVAGYPAQTLAYHSPKILEGGAYPFHGPETGRPLREVRPIGDGIDFASTDAGAGLLSIHPGSSRGRYDFWVEGLDIVPLSRMLGIDPAQLLKAKSGLSLLSAPVNARGSILWNSGQPRVDARFDSPWLVLERQQGEPVPLALRGTLSSSLEGKVSGRARISSHPYPLFEQASDLLLAGDYAWKTQDVRLRLITQGFPVESVRPLLPASLTSFLPSGKLTTERFSVWGKPWALAMAGDLKLRDGRIWLREQPIDMQQAQAHVSSQAGEVVVEDVVVKAGALQIEGEGRRGRDNRLSGLVKMHRLPLSFLDPLGSPWSELEGEVEAQVAFRGNGLIPDELFASVTSSRVVYTPAEGLPVSLEQLVLGRSPDPAQGIRLRMQAGEVVVDFPAESTSLTLAEVGKDGQAGTPGGKLAVQGRLRLPGLPRRSFQRWLLSATGPIFGEGKNPLVLSWQDLGWSFLGHYFPMAPRLAGDSSGQVRLLGQYFRTHQESAPAAASPFAQLIFEKLSFVRELNGVGGQGVLSLSQPLQANYARKGKETHLSVEPFKMDYQVRAATPAAAPRSGGGTLSGQARIPIMVSAKADKLPTSHAQLSINQVPLEMLSAFFPFLSSATGNVESLELASSGELLRPQLDMTMRIGQGSLGQLRFAQMDGRIQGAPEDKGRYRIDFLGGPQSPNQEFQVSLGPEVSPQHRLSLRGGLHLDWKRRIAPGPVTALVPAYRQAQLAETSSFDIHGELIDQQARLLATLIPNSETSGRLSGSLDLRGEVTAPDLSGSLTWENGSFKHAAVGQPLTGINLVTRFERIDAAQAEKSVEGWKPAEDALVSRYTLEKLEGYWGGRRFEGKGKTELSGGQPSFLNVTFSGKELPLKLGDYFQGIGDVDLRLAGRGGRNSEDEPYRFIPVLTGDVNLPKGDLNLPLSLAQPNPNWSALWKRNPIRYDIDLNVGDDVWAHILNSSVRGQGDLKVLPSLLDGSPVLAGELFLSRGTIRIPLYEIVFRVRQGYAYFEEDLVPVLENVEADTAFGGYQITARFDGKFPDVRAELVSNPPLPQNDLARLVGLDSSTSTLLSTSSPIDVINQQQQQNLLASSGAAALTNILTSQLTQGLGRLLFLSEVSFDFLPPADYTIRLAKALDDRDTFLLTFAQVVSNSRNNLSSQQYGVEWRFQPNLLSRLTVDNFGQARIWFQGLLRF